ncbi:MAG: hypothetical protein SGJ11_17430 [Phycisphaerae bacterium]|nr:hypothetical protein [Phycisphaerae bacterium]
MSRRSRRFSVLEFRSHIVGLLLVSGCMPLPAFAADCSQTSTGLVPLSDLGTGLYLDAFQGGLYAGGLNVPPIAHHQAVRQAAVGIVPRLAEGEPSLDGKLVFLSIGMSNATQEFCGGATPATCVPASFMAKAAANEFVDHDRLVIVDGAAGGQTAPTWDDPADANYDRVRDVELAPLGLTEAQVGAVWIKVANSGPSIALPASDADAFTLSKQIASIARAVKIRYPNCRIAFLTSRIYAGYASTPLNPEPYAYESGFGVKWVISEQISQAQGNRPTNGYGPLAIGAAAPALVWGPYLWADGIIPRSDGLTWNCLDFQQDGTHPATQAVNKVGTRLLTYFLESPYGRPWFRAEKTSDLDGDGFVNGADLAVILAGWGPCGACAGDLDWDGAVGASDLSLLLAEWSV